MRNIRNKNNRNNILKKVFAVSALALVIGSGFGLQGQKIFRQDTGLVITAEAASRVSDHCDRDHDAVSQATRKVKKEERQSGSVDTGNFIGLEAAKSAAFSHSGIKAENAYKVEAELDYEHGQYVYEVEFKSGGYEYEYDIDAVTGEVLKFEKEYD